MKKSVRFTAQQQKRDRVTQYWKMKMSTLTSSASGEDYLSHKIEYTFIVNYLIFLLFSMQIPMSIVLTCLVRSALFCSALLNSSHVDGHLYELDGRKAFPINHGPSTADTVLEDATAVVKKFMERDPEELRFTIIALAATSE